MLSYLDIMDIFQRNSHEHAEILKNLERVVEEIALNPDNEELQQMIIHNLNKLAKLRSEILEAGRELLDRGIDPELDRLIFTIGTLSEYMVIVGLEYEKDLLDRITSVLGDRAEHTGIRQRIERELLSISELRKVLEVLVERYY